jgi:hypothetical protein
VRRRCLPAVPPIRPRQPGEHPCSWTARAHGRPRGRSRPAMPPTMPGRSIALGRAVSFSHSASSLRARDWA